MGTAAASIISAEGRIAPPDAVIDELPSTSADAVRAARSAAATWFGASTFTAESQDPDARLAVLAGEGIAAEVLIPDIALMRLLDADVQLEWARASNDWLAGTFGGRRDRFALGITLPQADVTACVAELQRCAAIGLNAAVLPEAVWDNEYFDPSWEPFWEAASALGVSVVILNTGTRSVRYEKLAEHPSTPLAAAALSSAFMVEQVGWFVMSGVLARHPELTVVFAGAGAGWLGWVADFYDWCLRDSRLGRGPGLEPTLDEPPSFYIRRQLKATFTYDPIAITLRTITGAAALLWGAGYPAPGSSIGESQVLLDKQMSDLPQTDIDLIVCHNAATTFGLDLTTGGS